jgi:hypothetical protein
VKEFVLVVGEAGNLNLALGPGCEDASEAPMTDGIVGEVGLVP